jgi:hypothetical protein
MSPLPNGTTCTRGNVPTPLLGTSCVPTSICDGQNITCPAAPVTLPLLRAGSFEFAGASALVASGPHWDGGFPAVALASINVTAVNFSATCDAGGVSLRVGVTLTEFIAASFASKESSVCTADVDRALSADAVAAGTAVWSDWLAGAGTGAPLQLSVTLTGTSLASRWTEGSSFAVLVHGINRMGASVIACNSRLVLAGSVPTAGVAAVLPATASALASLRAAVGARKRGR